MTHPQGKNVAHVCLQDFSDKIKLNDKPNFHFHFRLGGDHTGIKPT